MSRTIATTKAAASKATTDTPNFDSGERGKHFLNFYCQFTGLQLWYKCIDNNEYALSLIDGNPEKANIMYSNEFVKCVYNERGVKKEVDPSKAKAALEAALKAKKSA